MLTPIPLLPGPTLNDIRPGCPKPSRNKNLTSPYVYLSLALQRSQLFELEVTVFDCGTFKEPQSLFQTNLTPHTSQGVAAWAECLLPG